MTPSGLLCWRGLYNIITAYKFWWDCRWSQLKSGPPAADQYPIQTVQRLRTSLDRNKNIFSLDRRMSVAQLICQRGSAMLHTQAEGKKATHSYHSWLQVEGSPLLSWLVLRHLQGKRETEWGCEGVTEQRALCEERRNVNTSKSSLVTTLGELTRRGLVERGERN